MPSLSLCRDKFATVRTIEIILVNHLDDKLCCLPASHTHERMATRLLLDRKMLELARDGTCTKITERGRDTLAGLLAEHAERLLIAHLANDAARFQRVASALAPQPQRRYPWGDGEISRTTAVV